MSYVPLPTVYEREGRTERAWDIYSRLLRDRIIFIGTPINDFVANAVIAQMLFLQMEDAKKASKASGRPGESMDEDVEELEEKEETGKVSDLHETISALAAQNEKLESVIYQLSDTLEETLLSNAKLIYQNRTLSDASLNERQKSKIVEAIAAAESPKEAKQLHETLKATVGSQTKKGPQSLSESVNRRSNLSSMLNTRQNLSENKSADPFMEKMQKLAGIK